MKYNILKLVFCVAILIAGMTFVIAAPDDYPMGAQRITVGANSRMNASMYAPVSVNAEAGNVTEINISGRSATRSWQGFYGEITGTLVLENAQNKTLYEWSVTEPKGEVFAINQSTIPTWDNIHCFNFTADGAADMNVTNVESSYNMEWTQGDGINETFNITDHPRFSVGEQTFQPDTCPSVWLYEDDAPNSEHWSQVLLSDYNVPIFMAIIENNEYQNDTDPLGFDGVTHDFQLIVPEDGTSLDGSDINQLPTTYYFYLDLE